MELNNKTYEINLADDIITYNVSTITDMINEKPITGIEDLKNKNWKNLLERSRFPRLKRALTTNIFQKGFVGIATLIDENNKQIIIGFDPISVLRAPNTSITEVYGLLSSEFLPWNDKSNLNLFSTISGISKYCIRFRVKENGDLICELNAVDPEKSKTNEDIIKNFEVHDEYDLNIFKELPVQIFSADSEYRSLKDFVSKGLYEFVNDLSNDLPTEYVSNVSRWLTNTSGRVNDNKTLKDIMGSTSPDKRIIENNDMDIGDVTTLIPLLTTTSGITSTVSILDILANYFEKFTKGIRDVQSRAQSNRSNMENIKMDLTSIMYVQNVISFLASSWDSFLNTYVVPLQRGVKKIESKYELSELIQNAINSTDPTLLPAMQIQAAQVSAGKNEESSNVDPKATEENSKKVAKESKKNLEKNK